MKRLIVILALTISVLGLTMKLALGQSSMPPKEAFDALAGLTDPSQKPTYRERVTGPVAEHYVFNAGEDVFFVNADTNQVASALWVSRASFRPEIMVDQAAARVRAEAFAKRIRSDILLGQHQYSEELIDHGDWKEYNFVWVQTFDGIETPNFLLVSVDANNGNIVRFNSHSQPITLSDTVSRISKEQALETAMNSLHDHIEQSNAKLIIKQIDRANTQKLVWRISLVGIVGDAKEAREVLVDAQSGQILP